MQSAFTKVLQKAKETTELNKEEIKILLSANEVETPSLYQYAEETRAKYMGDEVHLRGIIEFSNYCKQNCHYCGLRYDNRKLKRYRLSYAEIYATAKNAVQAGYKTVVLQAGEDNHFTAEGIAQLIKDIKKLAIAITLSCGEHDYETYKLWRQAGADRYLIKHETADPELFSKIRPGKTLTQRLQCQKWLKELGYQIGSGCMVGLPGQTLDTLAEDLLLLQKMDVDMAGIGPFIPHPETPLAKSFQGTVGMTLKMVAVARILMPLLHLPSTTALATLHPRGSELGLQAGANVIMPNVSPVEFKKLYQIYPNKVYSNENINYSRNSITEKIKSLGRTISYDYGHCPKYLRRLPNENS